MASFFLCFTPRLEKRCSSRVLLWFQSTECWQNSSNGLPAEAADHLWAAASRRLQPFGNGEAAGETTRGGSSPTELLPFLPFSQDVNSTSTQFQEKKI